MTIGKMVMEMVGDFYAGNDALITKYYLRGRSFRRAVVVKAYEAYKQAGTREEKLWVLQQIKLAK